MTSPRYPRYVRVFVLALVVGHVPLALSHSGSWTRRPSTPSAAAPSLPSKFPVLFEINEGQADPAARFIVRGPDYVGFLTPEGLTTIWNGAKDRQSEVARLAFLLHGRTGPTSIDGESPRSTRINHFVGSDSRAWRTDIRTFSRVRYRDIYPGIDLVFHGEQGQLEYDFVVAPGADPSVIALEIDGADRADVDDDSTSRFTKGLEP